MNQSLFCYRTSLQLCGDARKNIQMDVSETHFAGTVLLNSLACLDGIAHKKTSGEEASAGPDHRCLPQTATISHHQLLRSLERND